MIHRLTPLLVCLACIAVPIGVVADEDRPTIAAAVVESMPSAEVVRLVVSPPMMDLSHKIICGDESIRIRLGGVASRRRNIENLSVPEHGPMKRVRIVPRGSAGSVVQIYPRRRALATCSRTTLISMGGEIVISTALSQLDKTIKERLVASENQTIQERAETAGDEEKHNISEKQPTPSDQKSAKKAAAKPVGLFAKKKSKSSPKNEPADNDAPIGAADSEFEMNAVRLLTAFGFVAVITGLAMYVKRRKRRVGEGGDTIEIISSKRLGARQQLVLASVQDTKFLLAVGEKSVSTLGVVPDENRPTAVDDELPRETVGNVQEAEPALAQWIKEQQLKQREESEADRPAASSSFNQQFNNAVNAALAVDDLTPRDENGLSNAAGLIAMARMRADIKRNADRTPVVEA